MSDEIERLSAELERVLPQLYTDSDSAKMVADNAGIPHTFIDFNGPMVEVWHRIVQQATARSRLPELVRVVVNQYPNRPEVQRIYGFFLYSSRPPKANEMSPPSESTAQLERSVARLNEIINGTDWGAEGLKGTTKRIESEVKTMGLELSRLSTKVSTLETNQTFNRRLLITLSIVNFILAITILVSLSGIWRGVG